MSNYADRPLVKVTLNLYKEDVDWFHQTHGAGYTQVIRKLVHEHVKVKKEPK